MTVKFGLWYSYVFWMGDFNFRIDGLANELVRKAAAAGDFSSLWKYDQVSHQTLNCSTLWWFSMNFLLNVNGETNHLH